MISRAIAVVLLLLASCGTDVRRQGQVDQSTKTIIVPPGSFGLLGEVKDALRAEGWTLTLNRGPIVTEGTVGPATKLETSRSFSARYRLHVIDRRVDSCLASGLYRYEISIADNQTGQEVVTLAGTDCGHTIASKLRSAIRGQQDGAS